jgi:hypothetical protein
MPASGSDTAEGIVFNDRNGDGQRQPSEPGVKGVSVSNGLDVVATDGKGRYSIPIRDGETLFITKPVGWSVPSNPSNLPRFFYHHVPDGAPSDRRPRYRGIPATGPLPASIDFPLQRQSEPQNFTSVWFADTQPQSKDEVEFIRDDVVAELIGNDGAFGITLGDITYDDLSLYGRLARNIGQIGVPWYHVPGNHDVNALAPSNDEAFDTFRRHFGPPYYSFDWARVHFVILNTVTYEGTSLESEDPDPLGKGPYRGELGQRQLEWLAKDLAQVDEDRLVVLAMHIPLRSELDDEAPRINVSDREQLFQILEGRKHLLAVAGHMHLAEHSYFDRDDGFDNNVPLHLHTLSAVCGSWWSGPLDMRGIPTSLQRDGSPRGYYLMEVDGVDVTMRFKATGKTANHQMRITLDTGYPRHIPDARLYYRHGELLGNRIDQAKLYSTRVLVNLFEGGPRSTVSYRIGDSEEIEMQRVTRHDPFVEELYQREADSMKPWVEVEPTSHIWEAPLPDGLGPGVHTISVRATDEYGLVHTDHKLFEVFTMRPVRGAGAGGGGR